MNGKRKRVLVLALYVLISVWFFRGVVFRGEVFMSADALWNFEPWKSLASHPVKVKNGLMMDTIQTYYPAYVFSSRWLRGGHVPLWNPHIMCGVPFAAVGQGLFYPLDAFFNIMGRPDAAFGWSALIHLVLAGVFAYSFLSVIGAGRAGAVLGGIVFMFNGWLAAWMLLPNFLHAGVWLPLMLCLYELSIKRKSAAYAMLSGVAGAMPFMAGNVQVAAYAHLFLCAYAAYRTARSGGPRVLPAAYWALSAVSAAMLAAPQILSTLDLMTRSQRPVIASVSGFMQSPFDLKHLILGFLPNFYGDPIRDNYWGKQNYTAFCFYVGVVPMVLGAGAVALGRMRERWFFFAAAVCSLLLALGTPLNFVFALTPGLNRLPPFRIIYLLAFSLSMLAGMGAGPLLEAAGAARKKWVGVWLAYFLVFAVGAVWAFHSSGVGARRLAAFEKDGFLLWTAFAAAGVLLSLVPGIGKRVRTVALAVLILLDLGLWANWYNPSVSRSYLFPETPSISFLQNKKELFRIHAVGEDWILFPNTSMYYGLFDIRGIESLYPGRYMKLIDAFSEQWFKTRNAEANVLDVYGYDAPALDLMNVRYILSKAPIGEKSRGRYVEEFKGDLRVTQNRGAFPRFFGMSRWRELDGEDAVLREVASLKFNPAAEVLLNRDEVKGRLDIPQSEPGGPGYVPLKIGGIIYMPDYVAFNVEAPRPLLLVASEANDPGWLAFINGKRVPIFTADYHFRSVPLPAGESAVTFVYRPAPILVGAYIALAAVAIILMVLFIRSAIEGVSSPALPGATPEN